MAGEGPKLTLTKWKAQQIITAIEQGAYMTAAAQSIGISRGTLFAWLAEGRALKARLEEQIGQGGYEVDRAVWEAEQRGNKGQQVDTLAHIRQIGEKLPYWICVELLDGVERAKAKAQLSMVKKLVNHAETDWRAAAWYLERTDPENYGRTDRVELSGPQGKPIEIAAVVANVETRLKELSDEELEGALKLVECIAQPIAIESAGGGAATG